MCVCVLGGVGIPRVVGAVGIWGVGILKGAVIWGVRYQPGLFGHQDQGNIPLPTTPRPPDPYYP